MHSGLMQCLICNDSINHARMGVNACRACAAFYKRTVGQFGRLKCKEGGDCCREKSCNPIPPSLHFTHSLVNSTDPKTTCRKCRLTRFKEVLARACQGSTAEVLHNSMDVDESSLARPSTFVDHTSFYDCEPSGSETPLLSRVRKGFSLMCVIRKAGEIGLKENGCGDRDIAVDNLILTPAAYSSIFPNTRIAQQAVVEFANLAFDDFRTLDENCKRFIMETSYSLINVLDSAYRAYHHFPGDMTINLPGYTTYFRDTDMDSFFDNCPDDIDKTNLINEVRRSREHSSKTVRQYFETAKPTDVEFLALFGLALWNDRLLERDETLSKIANSIRSEIMKELHVYYAKEGTADYASRLGNIFCLLVNSQNQSAKNIEDFQVFRLLNMYNSVFSKS